MKTFFNTKYQKFYRYFFIISILLLLYQYLIPIIYSDSEPKDLFFLSLGYPSDPVVLPLVIDFPKFFFSNDYHFSNNLYYLSEFLIYKLFGFNYIWITGIIYKIIFFLVIIKILSTYINLKNHKIFFIFALTILILITSGFGGNHDRLVRPSLLNIFESILILNLYKCYFRCKISYLDSLIIGISSASTLSMAPWNFFFIIPLFLINFKNLKKFNFTIFFLTFVIVYFPNIQTNFYVISGNNTHLEYLGIKEIYNIKFFLIDFIIEALKSKRILFGFIIILFISILEKKKIYLVILFSSLIFGFLPYIILGKTILSYHILQGLFDFLFFTCIFLFYKSCNENHIIKKQINFYYSKLKIILPCIILVYPFFIQNSWIERSKNLKKEYEKHFYNLDNIDKKLTIISNDKYIRFYLYLNSITYLPQDGYFNISLPKQTYQQIAEIIPDDKKNDNLLCMYLKSATENLFDSTRSTKSKLINYKKSILLNSVSSWILTIPDEVKNQIYNQKNFNKKNYFYFDNIYGYNGYIGTGSEKAKCKFEKN